MKMKNKWKKEETVTHREFQNMLQNKTYNGDKSYRMQEMKYLDNKIFTLNKEQSKIFDQMLDIIDTNILKVLFKSYKLEQHNREANYT